MSVSYKLVTLILTLTLDGQVHTGNIYGGHVAAPHSRPYMAVLERVMQSGKTIHCGGFLLNEDFVMTAAHCQAKSYNVLLGVQNIRDLTNVQTISVEQEFPHTSYNARTFSNDIMLLKLKSKAQFNKYVRPIALADQGGDSLPKACMVSGWGRNNESKNYNSDLLMEVNVTLIHDKQCHGKSVYCSDGNNGPRQGDSGGPLVCEDGKAFGVVSAGTHPDSNGLRLYAYTKIPAYTEWIESIIKSAMQLKFM